MPSPVTNLPPISTAFAQTQSVRGGVAAGGFLDALSAALPQSAGSEPTIADPRTNVAPTMGEASTVAPMPIALPPDAEPLPVDHLAAFADMAADRPDADGAPESTDALPNGVHLQVATKLPDPVAAKPPDGTVRSPEAVPVGSEDPAPVPPTPMVFGSDMQPAEVLARLPKVQVSGRGGKDRVEPDGNDPIALQVAEIPLADSAPPVPVQPPGWGTGLQADQAAEPPAWIATADAAPQRHPLPIGGSDPSGQGAARHDALASPEISDSPFSLRIDTALSADIRDTAGKTPAADGPPTVTVRDGRFGSDVGIAIARLARQHAGADEPQTFLIRLEPRHMGRIDVRMSFDDGGMLRAVVSADQPVALDMLRRESLHLDRALFDAGVRADAQSLRFDSAEGGGQGQRHSHRHASPGEPDQGAAERAAPADIPEIRFLRGSGHLDLMA